MCHVALHFMLWTPALQSLPLAVICHASQVTGLQTSLVVFRAPACYGHEQYTGSDNVTDSNCKPIHIALLGTCSSSVVSNGTTGGDTPLLAALSSSNRSQYRIQRLAQNALTLNLVLSQCTVVASVCARNSQHCAACCLIFLVRDENFYRSGVGSTRV